MDYGTIFHHLIELSRQLGSKYNHQKVTRYISEWVSHTYGTEDHALLARIALEQFRHFRTWEAQLPGFTVFNTEDVFCVDFQLPPTCYRSQSLDQYGRPEVMVNIPGVTIPLKGRIDGLLLHNGQLWLEENKTKSNIDMSTLDHTLCKNIQVMFYAVAAQLKYRRPVAGVVYNVIRKPNERIRSGRMIKGKRTGGESENQFVSRISKNISDCPDHYFKRLRYEFPPGAVEEWQRRSLIPMLYDLYIWWRSWEDHPTQPWQDAQGNINPFHGELSFGIFDPMSVGLGDYYKLITTGSTVDLRVDPAVHTELSDDPYVLTLMQKHFP